MLTKIKMALLENATHNIGHPHPQSSWAQSHQVDNSTNHSGYPSRPGPSVQSPASNVSNFSEESSILDMYEFSEFQ